MFFFKKKLLYILCSYISFILLFLLPSCTEPYQIAKPLPADIAITPTQRKTSRVIVLDAGHGDQDHGACSHDGEYKEKNLNLTTALMVRKQLQAMGYKTIMMRHRDYFLSLQQRVNKANRLSADLFVCIHYNSSSNRKAEGVEIFYHNGMHQGQINKRAQASQVLAQILLHSITQKTHCPSRGVKEGNFYVIRNTQMPAVLIEGGFMTNPKEMAKLKDQKYLNQIAIGIACGIDQYFAKH